MKGKWQHVHGLKKWGHGIYYWPKDYVMIGVNIGQPVQWRYCPGKVVWALSIGIIHLVRVNLRGCQ